MKALHSQPVDAVKASPRAIDIRDAAVDLFAERGFHGTTMRDIAATLGMQAASLYNHISSKQALLADIMRETSLAVWNDYERATRGLDDPTQCLEAATRAYVARHAKHRSKALVVNRELHSLTEPVLGEVRELRIRHQRAIHSIVTAGIWSGAFTLDRPSLGTFAILEMGVSVARWFNPGGELSLDDVADHYAEFAARIVGAGLR